MSYTEGQRLQGSDGKTYVVVGGVPREDLSQGPAPSAGPPAFIPGRPKPERPQEPPSGYRAGPGGTLEIIPGGPADPNRPEKPDLPSGWERGPDGNARPIPGLPATAVTGMKPAKTPEETAAERKSAGFLERAVGADKNFVKVEDIGGRSVPGQWAANMAPDLVNAVSSDKRQMSDQAQREFIAAVLRLDSGAAIPPEELVTNQRIYFPQPNDSEANLKQKAGARFRAINSLRIQAGLDPLPEPPAAADEGDTADKDAAALAAGGGGMVSDGSEPPDGEVLLGWFKNQDGTTAPIYGTPGTQFPAGDGYIPNPANQQAQRLDADAGQYGAVDLAGHGLSLGLTDEGAGIGQAIGSALRGDFNIGENYRLGRDSEQIRLEAARHRLGKAGTAAELLGGFALPANALGRVATLGEAARGGAIAGGVGGFGYGRGAQESGVNALLGAGAGAALGAGGQKLGNALAGRSQRPAMAERAAALNEAGQAEGVTVNRAMVDPQSNNRISKTDATQVGGPVIQRNMRQIEGQVESRVQGLGRGGNAMDDIATGDTVKGAADRFIDRTGRSASKKYDRAEKLAGGAKVEPKESLARVNDMIASLGETPNTNQAEIRFLESIRDDLNSELSVGALRRMRTQLRKRISKGELTFGEDEGRVLSIMDGAADDIRAGLASQGKEQAAQAFDAADKSYRARMDYIQNTVQRLVGKRNANLSSEQVAKRFTSMAGNDARGLRKFYATLNPEEQADVAASFADRLGKNNKGEFSIPHFLSQTQKMSDEAIRTVFGPEGAQSVKNLRTLGQEVARVTGAMNSRTSKSGVAGYRDWLFSLAAGGLPGAVGSGGNVVTTGATALAGAAVKGAHDVFSARALMSPKISKWLLQAPNTKSPAAINAHFNRLGEIAKAEPALTGEIDALRQAIMGAANDNVGVSAAAGDRKEDKQKQ